MVRHIIVAGSMFWWPVVAAGRVLARIVFIGGVNVTGERVDCRPPGDTAVFVERARVTGSLAGCPIVTGFQANELIIGIATV